MAIGLGRMFGFRFQENFNYPYISRSLREFWKRWHISLSTWFHGFFIACEHAGFNKILERLWAPIQHCYLISIILFSWVLFRSEDIDYAVNYMKVMSDIDSMSLTGFQIERLINNEAIIVFVVGCILSTPLYRLIHRQLFEFQGSGLNLYLC